MGSLCSGAPVGLIDAVKCTLWFVSSLPNPAFSPFFLFYVFPPNKTFSHLTSSQGLLLFREATCNNLYDFELEKDFSLYQLKSSTMGVQHVFAWNYCLYHGMACIQFH